MRENKPEDVDFEQKQEETGFITKASAQYCDKFPLRAAIQAIPGLGSSLDTMLAGLGANWQYKRLEDFIAELNKRLSRLKQLGNLSNITPSEPLFDFMMQTFDQVIRARSEKKRIRFANLVANQVEKQCNWDEVEIACHLIGELSYFHIQVLDVSVRVRENDLSKDGLFKAVTIREKSSPLLGHAEKPTELKQYFPSLSYSMLQMICSELVSKGLLHDKGVSYTNREAMELFIATDLAKWLIDWISEPGGMKNMGESD